MRTLAIFITVNMIVMWFAVLMCNMVMLNICGGLELLAITAMVKIINVKQRQNRFRNLRKPLEFE